MKPIAISKGREAESTTTLDRVENR